MPSPVDHLLDEYHAQIAAGRFRDAGPPLRKALREFPREVLLPPARPARIVRSAAPGAARRVWMHVEHRTRRPRGVAAAARAAGADGAFSPIVRALPPPPVAAVVVGRNDDYMPDFFARTCIALAANLRSLLAEVVFVEWNPPPDRPLLSPALARRFPQLRAYVVPPDVHAEVLAGRKASPLLEYHAKNAGIRRARSPWIVATNSDTVFGTGTVARIRLGPLRPDVVWTAQRIDLDWPAGRTRGIGLLDRLHPRRLIPRHEWGSGEFLLAARDLWHHVGGYDEGSVMRLGNDVRGAANMAARGARLRRAGAVFHMAHETSVTERIATLGDEPRLGADGLPYDNLDSWGLADCAETEVAERVFRLEPR